MAETVLGFRIEVKGTDAQTSNIAKLEQSLVRLRQERTRLNKKVRDGKVLTKSESAALGTLKTRISATTSALREQTKQLKVNGQAQAKTTSFTQKMGKSIVGAGAAMFGIGAAIGLVTRGFSAAIGIIVEYQKSNSKLEAVLGATEAQMISLKNQSKDLGSTTAFTASQVAELQIEYAKLGFPTEDILNMTQATLNGAAALGSGLGEQAALTGAVMKQFGIDSSETGRVVDVMAKAAASSALDFSKLATALPIVGATAASAGVSLERTTALLGTLSDRGLDASTSGTALRNMFLELSKQGLTYNEAMAKINTSTDKNATAFEIFGKRGATMGVILAGSNATLEELEGKLNNANGAARLMAQTMLDNVAGDTTIAQSAIEGLILSLEDGDGALSQMSRSAIQLGTTYLNMLTALNNGDVEELSNTWLKHIGVLSDTVVEYETATGTIVLSQEDLVKASQNSSAAVDVLKERFNSGAIDAAKFQKGIELLAGGYKRLSEEERNAAANENALAEKQKLEDDKLQIEVNAGIKSTEVEKKTAERKEKNREKTLEKLRQEEAAELAAEEEFQDEDFNNYVNAELRKKTAADELRAAEKERKEIEFEENTELTILANEKEISDAATQQELVENAKNEKRQIGLNAASSALNIFSQFQQQASDRKLINLENDTNKEIALLQGRLDKGLISQEEFDTKKASIEAETAEKTRVIKKKAFEQQKKASIIQATISAAQAVLQAAAGTPAPANVPLIVLAGVLGAAQIALISSQPTPSFEDGGLVSGASHANGGIQMHHKNGQHLGEMEGNEYIMSRATVDRIGVDNLDAMNFGSGSSNGFFANGGSVPNVSGLSASSISSSSNLFDMTIFADIISTQMQEAIVRTPVINNATDTAQVAASVINTEAELSFG